LSLVSIPLMKHVSLYRRNILFLSDGILSRKVFAFISSRW
jgi:hypothetical protein